MELNDLIENANRGNLRLLKHRIKRTSDFIKVDDPVHCIQVAEERLHIHHCGKTACVKIKDLQTIEFDPKTQTITCTGPIIVMRQNKLRHGGGWEQKLSTGIRLVFAANEVLNIK